MIYSEIKKKNSKTQAKTVSKTCHYMMIISNSTPALQTYSKQTVAKYNPWMKAIV